MGETNGQESKKGVKETFRGYEYREGGGKRAVGLRLNSRGEDDTGT